MRPARDMSDEVGRPAQRSRSTSEHRIVVVVKCAVLANECNHDAGAYWVTPRHRLK